MVRNTTIIGVGAAAVIASVAGLATWASTRRAVPVPTVQKAEAKIDSSYRLAQVGEVMTYRPSGPVRGVALFLSGDGGWPHGVIDMARILQARGVAVARFNTPVFLKSMEAGKDKCMNPNYALTVLAQDFEHRLGMPHYLKPILLGYSSGATVAYAALATAPAGTYRGAVSLGFGPDIYGVKPWCGTPGLDITPITKPEKGWLFGAMPRLSAPWLVLQGMEDQSALPAITRDFTARIPEAQLIEFPKVGHGFAVEARWVPQLLTGMSPMLAPPITRHPADRASVDDLPLAVVADPAAPRTEMMAVLYSGDGGWAGLDRDIAARLAASGVPVIGVDSLQYFWNAKTPSGAGQDLGRIINHFSQQWRRPRVILLGYSFGADDLPYIIDAMPPSLRPSIARFSMLGLDDSADFQFHLSSWLDVSGDNALPTIPAIERIKGIDMQCIRGSEESESACEEIPSGIVHQVELPGGHHYNGNAMLIADTILKGLKT